MIMRERSEDRREVDEGSGNVYYALMWYQHLDSIKPHIFQDQNAFRPGGGTGFLIFLNGGLCGLATAYHVIEHEYEWDEPIKVVHHESKKERLLKSSDRVIFDYPKEDLAFILFSKR